MKPILIFSLALATNFSFCTQDFLNKITKFNDIPDAFIQAVDVLNKQPLFDGDGNIPEKSKVLPVDDWPTCRIFEIINNNANKLLDKNNIWSIHAFGCGDNQLSDATGKHIPQGLTLWLYDDILPCPLENLKKAYNQVIEDVKINWNKTTLKQNPEIMFKENEEKYFIFTKKKSKCLIEEDCLIRFLVRKLNLEEKVKCHDKWLKPKAGYKFGDLYMWVKKEAIIEVKTVLQLALP